MNWMTCNTCKTIVCVNDVGICKACQAGFAQPSDDSYEYHKTQEKIDALEERLQQEDNQQ